MRIIAYVLSAILALTLTGNAAFAADVTRADIDRGLKEVPAVLNDAGLSCHVINARYIGALTLPADPKVKDSKPTPASAYEVACQDGFGYSLLSMKPKSLSQDCLASLGNPTLGCKLPENSNPKAGLVKLMAQTGRSCVVADARYVGATADGSMVYEVSCGLGEGYIVKNTPGKPPVLNTCLETAKTNLDCHLTSLEAAKTYAKSLAAQVKKPCDVQDIRFVGATTSGLEGYEASCGADKGYMFTVDPKGAPQQQVDCALAQNFLGGCTLIDVTKTQTAERGLYTDLAKKAGFACNVSQYRLIGILAGNIELVELACSDRPDGGVGAFAEEPGKSKIYDCLMIGQLNQTCRLNTSRQGIYDKLSASLAAKGKGSCKVSNARFIGKAQEGDGNFFETACSDGAPGWVVKTSSPDGYAATNLIPCAGAGGSLSCKLSENLKK